MIRKRMVRAVLATVLVIAGCGGGTSATPTPSPSASAADIALPDFNSRLGSNRVAAEAAATLGRHLYARGQYWEVYVRTTPPVLGGTFDPAHPELSEPAAAQATAADVIIATEAGASIKAFGAGGKPAQQATLADLDSALRKSFPALGAVTMRVFYGESYQYATAVFDKGKLTRFDVKS
jgi:hypothetical protein